MKLIDQTHHVVLYPAFPDFAINNANHREACHNDRFSSWRNSKDSPVVIPSDCDKRTNFVSLGNLVFDRNFEVWECGAKHGHDLPNAVDSHGSARRRVVIDVGTIEEGFEEIQSSFIEDFFDEVSVNEFVSFEVHVADQSNCVALQTNAVARPNHDDDQIPGL